MAILSKKYNCKSLYYAIVFFFILVISLVILEVFTNFLPQKADGALAALHDASLIILTVIIIWVAWYQLGALSKISRSDLLLRIDNRFSSHEIIMARITIHKLYRETDKLLAKKKTDEAARIFYISEKIKEIGKSQDEKNIKDFVYLLNFLDFLETIAFFCNKKYISSKEANELLGGSIEYYYKIFIRWIEYRRKKYGDDDYYCELSQFVIYKRCKEYSLC